MHLVHQTKGSEGKWEVAWVWLPHFIATNPDIVRYVADKMTQKYRGEEVGEDTVAEMSLEVINLIVDKLPIPGLREYLTSTMNVHPEEELP